MCDLAINMPEPYAKKGGLSMRFRVFLQDSETAAGPDLRASER